MEQNLLINIATYSLYVWVYVTIVYIIAIWKKDNSVMDIAYGPAFFVSAGAFLFDSVSVAAAAYLITGLIGLWSVRLSVRIFKKNFGKPEDPRYAAWRSVWTQRGFWYFYIRSYLQINLLQGVVIIFVSLPFLVAVSTIDESPLWSTLLGVAVFLFGLCYETLADKQLDRYLARKRAGSETAPIMTTGLFRFSRRPNYFGESLIWWGLALIVLPLPFGWVALLSPIIITYIVTKVTGPMLENIFLEKYPIEYRAYMATTNYFIPNFFSARGHRAVASPAKTHKNLDNSPLPLDTSTQAHHRSRANEDSSDGDGSGSD